MQTFWKSQDHWKTPLGFTAHSHDLQTFFSDRESATCRNLPAPWQCIPAAPSSPCQASWVLFASAGKFLHVADSQSLKKVCKSCECAVKPACVFQWSWLFQKVCMNPADFLLLTHFFLFTGDLPRSYSKRAKNASLFSADENGPHLGIDPHLGIGPHLIMTVNSHTVLPRICMKYQNI